MPELSPIYTRDNCTFSAPLQWGLSVFWREPIGDDSWFEQLAAATEVDGIRLLGHRFREAGVSQFAISTKPEVAPVFVVQRVKGRLQHAVRDTRAKALKGNYGIRSFGQVTREVVENYVACQLGHHQMADPRVQARFARFQIECPSVDLSQPRMTSHGMYWYNLHVVIVHRQRLPEIREEVLSRVRDMIVNCCDKKSYLLSRAGILADHVHLVLGCPIEVSPADVALGLLNNLAYAHGMKAVFQYGAFLGTVGEYDSRAVTTETSPHGHEARGGEEVWGEFRSG
jgi:REP element-mobilizing transposase RayT